MSHTTGKADVLPKREASVAPASRRFLTLPNLLTLSRLPMAGLAWLLPSNPFFILGLMALAGITDVLDGRLERKRRERDGEPGGARESVGAWLDPVCDKVFILSVLMAVTVAHNLPLWIIPLIGLREILQTLVVGSTRLIPAVRRRLHPRFQANILGKVTTIAQFITIAAILLRKPGQIPLSIATGILGLVAVVVYVRRAL